MCPFEEGCRAKMSLHTPLWKHELAWNIGADGASLLPGHPSDHVDSSH